MTKYSIEWFSSVYKIFRYSCVLPVHPQVSQDGKALLDKLQRPLTPGSADSLTSSANYSKAVHHVLDIIHEVLHHQRQLENIWQHRKLRLHQRLQLCVFQQDVQQVRHLFVTNNTLYTYYCKYHWYRFSGIHLIILIWEVRDVQIGWGVRAFH